MTPTLIVSRLALLWAALLLAFTTACDGDDQQGSPVPVVPGVPSMGSPPAPSMLPPPPGPAPGETPPPPSSPLPALEAAPANAWTQMGGDARNWYYNPNETTLSPANAAQMVEKWRAKIGGFAPGSALIVSRRVFFMGTTGTYAFDLANGEKIWERRDLGGTASLAYHAGSLYAHLYEPRLYRLDAEDGTDIWGPVDTYLGPNADAEMPMLCDGISSPIVGAGTVVVGRSCGTIEVGDGAGGGLAKGGLEAVDIESGTKLWSYQSTEGDEDGAMVWSSVGIDESKGVVYATTGNNYTVLGANSDSIHAVDLATGERLWRQQGNTDDLWSLRVVPGGPDTDFGANPILTGDGMVAAGDKGSTFWAMDEMTGAVLWSRGDLSERRDAAHGGVLMNGAFDGEVFYVLANDSGSGTTNLVAMNKADGSDRWPPKKLMGTVWGSPSLANGLLFVPLNSQLVVFNAATGEELNRFDTGGTIAAGGPAIAEGHVCVGSGLQYPFSRTAVPNDEIICYGLP